MLNLTWKHNIEWKFMKPYFFINVQGFSDCWNVLSTTSYLSCAEWFVSTFLNEQLEFVQEFDEIHFWQFMTRANAKFLWKRIPEDVKSVGEYVKHSIYRFLMPKHQRNSVILNTINNHQLPSTSNNKLANTINKQKISCCPVRRLIHFAYV